MEQQVLVHVAAPSRLRNDRQYQRLADEIACFEIAAVTHVYGFVGLTHKNKHPSSGKATELSCYRTIMTLHSQLSRPPTSSQAVVDLLDRAAIPDDREINPLHLDLSMPPTGEEGNLDERVDHGNAHSVIWETPIEGTEQVNGLKLANTEQSNISAKWMGQWQIVKEQTSKGSLQMDHKCNNPPFKNPFHGIDLPDKAVQVIQTPHSTRPRTAPSGSTGIMHETRGSFNQAYKRSISASFVENSYPTTSVVLDSQPPARKETDLSKKFSETLRSRRASSVPADTFIVDLHPGERNPQNKRRRVIDPENDRLIVEAETEEFLSSAMLINHRLGRPYQVLPPAGCESPYFLCDRSEDWTSSAGPPATDMSSNDLSSTVSPSQPLALRLSQTRLTPPALAQPRQPIDLISTLSSVMPVDQKGAASGQTSSPTRPDTHASPCLSSIPFSSSGSMATRNFYPQASPSIYPVVAGASGTSSFEPPLINRQPHFTSSIRSLPDRILAPSPPVGLGAFDTHVSTPLAIMVAKLPLAQHFRPVQVTRDVHILERGHWSLCMTIASEAEVADARRPPTQKEIFTALERSMAASTSVERGIRYESWKSEGGKLEKLGLVKRCDLWTEDEFLTFWKTLKTYVEDGKAGHGLSVAKDWTEDASVMHGRSMQSRQARIRIYTWGEVLGHVWIALWVLSDKKTAYIPMEWIATDDSVVIKMSGHRHKGGKLGAWVFKGSQGSWGIEAGTPPCGQGEAQRLSPCLAERYPGT